MTPRHASRLLLLCALLAVSVSTPAPAVAASAAIRLRPTAGPPTTPTRVRGEGFGSQEAVDLEFDGGTVGSARTNRSGRFRQTIDVPASALPGDHVVTAMGEISGESAQATFTVRTDWRRFHFDDTNSGFNPYENVIGPSNVGTLTTRWTAEIGAYNAASPVVVGGVVYGASYFGWVYGFDANTGAKVWSAFTHGLIGSEAPTIAGNSLYIGNLDGKVFAFDLRSGAAIWSVDTQETITTPVAVSNGVVYLSTSNRVYALDASTGIELWESLKIDPDGGPTVVERLVYVQTLTDIYALDALTGVIVWDARPPIYNMSGAVAAGEGLIFNGSSSNQLYAWDEVTGKLAWDSDAGGNTSGYTPVYADGVVYVASLNGFTGVSRIHAYDSVTGNEIWEANFGNNLSAVSSGALANGVLYFGLYPDKVSAYDATDGTLLWTSPPLGNYASGSPTIADGTLYVSTPDGTIFAFGLPRS